MEAEGAIVDGWGLDAEVAATNELSALLGRHL
jgi:hypothetical protein